MESSDSCEVGQVIERFRIKRQAARAKAERDIRETAMDDQVRMEQHRIERMRWITLDNAQEV